MVRDRQCFRVPEWIEPERMYQSPRNPAAWRTIVALIELVSVDSEAVASGTWFAAAPADREDFLLNRRLENLVVRAWDLKEGNPRSSVPLNYPATNEPYADYVFPKSIWSIGPFLLLGSRAIPQ